MRSVICTLLLGFYFIGCVAPLEETLQQKISVVVVEGTITDLNEYQVVHLNYSKSDSVTGRFGMLPLTGASVEYLVDSSKVITLKETEAGRYLAPSDFRGEVGHTYQLRFTVKGGSHYQSTPELMPSAPPIQRVYQQFNPISLTSNQRLNGIYAAANDFYIDWQDPANQHNYYRWDWKIWEKQDWCHTCESGWYIIYDLDDKNLVEDCFSSPITNPGYFVNDYRCRTECWQILHNFDSNVFDDLYNNGGYIKGRRVAQIPYYQDKGCLVEIRQMGLTRQAYQYFKQLADQSQNTGGLADTPPTALAGNVKNLNNAQERVVGYFTASAVANSRYWLDRKENPGNPLGLFYALNSRYVSPEELAFDPNTGAPKPKIPLLSKRYSRPPTAPCLEGDNTTPTKPQGWRD